MQTGEGPYRSAATRRTFLKGALATTLAGGCTSLIGSGETAFAQTTGTPDKPRYGGIASMPIGGDPVLNPVIAPSLASYVPGAIMFDALTKPDATGKPVPNLAQRWELAPDGKTYTFHLRRDVKWHDGQPFTADDVKFTFDLIKNPKTATVLRGNYEPLERVEIADPYTVRFHLSRPYATLLSWLYWYSGIVPKHLLDGKDVNTYTEFSKQHPIGTGPFKFKQYKAAEYVIMERYDQYHGGRPYLDQLVLKIIPDPNTAIAELKSGGLNYLVNVAPQSLRATQRDPNVDTMFYDVQRYDFFAPNLNRLLWQDKRLRQALAYGLNRRALLNVTALSHGDLAFGPISPALGAYYNKTLKPYPYDPERAKALLKSAGWADTDGDRILEKDLGDGKRTPLRWKLTYIQGRSNLDAEGAIAKENWKAIGADLILEPTEYGQFQTREGNFDFDMVRDFWITLPDPDLYNFLSSAAAGKNGNNYSAWRSPEADRLLTDGQAESNPAKRRAIYWKFQELCREEEPVIFEFHPKEINAKTKSLQGMLPAHFRVNIYWTHKWWMKA